MDFAVGSAKDVEQWVVVPLSWTSMIVTDKIGLALFFGLVGSWCWSALVLWE